MGEREVVEEATQAQDSVSVEVNRTSTGKFSWSVKVKVFTRTDAVLSPRHGEYAEQLVNDSMRRLQAEYGEDGG